MALGVPILKHFRVPYCVSTKSLNSQCKIAWTKHYYNFAEFLSFASVLLAL